MVATKTHLESRAPNYLRKYKVFFVFGIILLGAQIYLAVSFLSIEDEIKYQKTNYYKNEVLSIQKKENEGLLKRTRQLKVPPDKYTTSGKVLNYNLTARLKLDLKSLNFTPMCEVASKEAVSAINRAQSQFCKEFIVNVTCLSQQDLLYPSKLQSYCPHSPGFTSIPKSIGCFQDDKELNLLSSYRTILKTTNSPENCAHLCLQSGYPYAGVEYSVECFCGKEMPLKSKQLPDSSCNMKCPGDPYNSCGGYLTINVYSAGIQKFQPQSARNSSLKGSEKLVKIAYLLTVNGRASRQVKRLINMLYDSSNYFYIHVDARQDYLYREMLEVEYNCKSKNILVAKDSYRHASIWGGASLLTTFLTSARQLLENFKDWDFLVNLSESDYPIKDNDRLVEFLSWNKGLNFVKSHGRETQRFLSKQGLDKTFVECEARMWRIGNRRLPYGIQIDGGSDWVALSRDFVEYVTNPYPDSLIKGLLKVFQYTLLPAESFFHTVLRNSKYCDTYVDNNLHVTNWKRKLGCKCQYKAIVDWCGCSPNDFKLDDFPRIRNTAEKNLFFARKFEPIVDQRIIDKIEEWLYPDKVNISVDMKGYDRYWQNLYHHEDASPLSDDTLMTISNSLARLSYKFLEYENKVKLLESTAYYRRNKFEGVLIRAKVDSLHIKLAQNNLPQEIEAFIHINRNFSLHKTWMNKILKLSVNTDYDQKEQIFRNLMGGIGPMSSPALSYQLEFGLNLPQNLTVLWVDPEGLIADANYIFVDGSSLTGFLKPDLMEPLAIGHWQIFLILSNKIIAKVNFLVSPLTHWKNQPLDYNTAREINHSYLKDYHVPKEVTSKWSDAVKLHVIPDAYSNSGVQIDESLNRWVDSFVSKYYEIIQVCLASDRKLEPGTNIEMCSSTDWSSLSPDPKSDICNAYQK